MVSASSYLQPPFSPQPSRLWAAFTKQEDHIIELMQDNDEIDELDR